MGCPEPRLLEAFTDGSCEPDEAHAVEAHLAACPACRAQVGQRRATVAEPVRGKPRSGATLPFGSKVGRYLILDALGRGGMGVVYAAYDPQLDRRVAIKVLRSERYEGDTASQARSRLLREAQAMAKLAHPNVIAVHDVGMLEEQVFVAMELVQGPTLTQWMKTKHPARDVLPVFVQAGRGLAAAHAAGIVHRDFKPANVLIGDDGRARVVDFGLAKPAEEATNAIDDPSLQSPVDPAYQASDTLTQAGLVVGTPAYMAPEQHQGRASARSDQFSFCVALYEALYGQHPFPAKNREELDALFARGKVSFPVRTDVPLRVRNALARGLRIDAEARFPSMDALLGHLSRRTSARVGAIATAALAGMALAVVVGVRAHRAAQGRLCGGGERDLAGIWDAPRREAMRRAFLATGRSYADAAWTGAALRLDGYTQQWLGLRQSVCEATRVRRVETEQTFAVRMACLDDRLDELRALSDVFASADATVVEHAVAAVGQLAPLDECAAATIFSRGDPAEVEPAARARLSAIEGRLDRAKALLDAGRYKEALAEAQAVDGAAEVVKDVALRARERRLLARIHGHLGDVSESEEAAYDAIDAAELSSNDGLVASSALLLANELAQSDQAHLGEAERWIDLAAAAATRGRRSVDLDREIADARAGLLLAEAKYQEAIPYATKAAALAEALDGIGSPQAANERLIEANAQAYLGHYDAAIVAYQQVVQELEKSLGPDHPLLANPLGNLGAVEMQRGHYDRAERFIGRQMQLIEHNEGSSSVDLLAPSLNLANVLINEGRASFAVAVLERALSIAQTHYGEGKPEVANVLVGLATAYREEGQLDRAAKAAAEAVLILDKSLGAKSRLAVEAHIEHGSDLTGLGRFTEAESELEEAAADAAAGQGPDSPEERDAFTALGGLYEKELAYDKALAAYRHVQEIFEREDGPTSFLVADPLGAIASIYLKTGRADQAVPLFERVVTLRDVPGAPPRDVAQAQFSLAQALWQSGQDRTRAVALAAQARAGFAAAGKNEADQLAAVDAWLAVHRP